MWSASPIVHRFLADIGTPFAATVFRTKKRASGETLALLAQLKVREHTVSY